MPSQRCTATGKNGHHCRLRTQHGEYCWMHLAQIKGLRIMRSTHPRVKDGGLFAWKDFATGEHVTIYSGFLMHGADPRDTGGGSTYVMQISAQHSVDAACTNTAPGRMINDARRSDGRFKNNCTWTVSYTH